MIWKKTGKIVSAEGTTVEYRPAKARINISVESRKRHIPHANGSGTWDHTSYFVILDGADVKEKWTLKDAKEYAEGLIHEGPVGSV
jgi:hypothetical protein